jgi:hypothetical protein
MTLAVQLLLGVITTSQALKIVNDWPENDLTCSFGIERLNKGSTDFATHAKGTLYDDASFPAAQSSLYWEDYQSSSVRYTYKNYVTAW